MKLNMKKNEIMIYDTTWMNLEAMLCERKQTQGHILGVHLCEISGTGKSIYTEDKSLPGGLCREKCGVTLT